MPANIVKKGQEPEWSKAKGLAAKYFKTSPDSLADDQYALVTYLFKKLTHQEVECKKEWEGILKKKESLSTGMFGPLFRAKSKKIEKKKESKEPKTLSLRETLYGIREAKQDEKGRKVFPVVIIKQGLGNLRDKNYYTAEAIKSGAQVYNGKKAYYDHPTATQEREQPGRSVREITGHYENVHPEKDTDGLWQLVGDLVPIQGDSKKDVTDILEHAIEYKKKFPDQDFIGVSINGGGEGDQMDYDSFLKEVKPSTQEMEKISQIEGQQINVIKKLTEATSADLVTEAGAGGKVIRENAKILTGPLFKKQELNRLKESTMLKEAMKKLFNAVSREEKEVALKEMQNEMDKKDGQEAAEKGMYEAISKKMSALKKKEVKKEDESEEAYEARMLQKACGEYEQEAKEGEKKEDQDDQMDADKSADIDVKDKKLVSDKKESEDEKKEDEKKEGDDHADEPQDKALIKKMMDAHDKLKGEMEAMKKEMESLMGKKKEAEDEAKKAHESAAKVKTELEIKKRVDLIESLLAESGLPRRVTENFKPVLEKCKNESDIKATAETLIEHARALVEETFTKASHTGFAEKVSYSKDENTDAIFLK